MQQSLLTIISDISALMQDIRSSQYAGMHSKCMFKQLQMYNLKYSLFKSNSLFRNTFCNKLIASVHFLLHPHSVTVRNKNITLCFNFKNIFYWQTASRKKEKVSFSFFPTK